MSNLPQFILDNAETEPEKVQDALIKLHEKGETVSDILEFVTELEKRKIKVPYPEQKVFDVCGTGGTGKKRINLSTALSVKLSADFKIAKHGNKAASGRVGSFDLIEAAGYTVSDTPEKVIKNLDTKNLAFVFAPAFHPSLKPLAPIRKSISHPTIFNYLGPLLSPVNYLTAQMIGVPHESVGEKLAEVCAHLGRNVLLVHDMEFGLDDISIGGQTEFWISGLDKKIHTGYFTPEDYGLTRVKDFGEIEGGDVETNNKIFGELINNRRDTLNVSFEHETKNAYDKTEGRRPQDVSTKAHHDFLKINQIVATEFFSKF